MTETLTFGQTINNKVDILFVIVDGGGVTELQQSLILQFPTFTNILKAAPLALDLHIAITTSDMGAPSDVPQAVPCLPPGNDGQFKSTAEGTCIGTTLAAGATYLADDGKGTTNFTDPIGSVLQCIGMVGDSSCGAFEQPLAATVHALGADNIVNGVPTPPAMNSGFLRPDASLVIIFLADDDDCSVPANTELFSLQGQPDGLSNPLGPLDHYRCIQYGLLCTDPTSANPTALISPPLNPPSDAQGTAAAPTLNLDNCQENDTSSGLLTPVSEFINQIKALKADPDNQIMAAAIAGPPTPFGVEWLSWGTASGQELFPQLVQSCSPASYGEPAVRLSRFLSGFPRSVLGSVCDQTYAASMTEIATTIAQLPTTQNCLTGQVQTTATGLPNCTVTAQVAQGTTTETVPYPNCAANGNTAPCWTLTEGVAGCPGGASISVTDAPGAPSASITATCTTCNAGAAVAPPGC